MPLVFPVAELNVNFALGEAVPIPTLSFVASTNSVLVSKVALPETVKEPSVPTLVSDEAVTPLAKVAPVKEPAGAEPSILTPVSDWAAELLLNALEVVPM